MTRSKTVNDRSAAIRMPGKIPAINRSPMEVSVMTPYKIMAMLGGIKIPRVPPAAVTPKARRRSYPCRTISGTAIAPIVAAVTGLDPQTAENPVQAKIVPTASDPGMRWSHN